MTRSDPIPTFLRWNLSQKPTLGATGAHDAIRILPHAPGLVFEFATRVRILTDEPTHSSYALRTDLVMTCSVGEENIMYRYTVLAALCVTTGYASAGELDPLQGGSIDLGGFQGVVYYTEADNSFRVVTTIAEGEAGLPVRFEATLDEGQSLTISVPGRLDERSQTVEISRAGGKLFVAGAEPPPELVRAGH